MNEILRQILFLPPQESTVAREIDSLHYSVILVTIFGAAAVAALAAYFLLRYRRSAGRGRFGTDQDEEHMPGGVPYWVEISAIAVLLVLFVSWWVVGFRQFVMLETVPRNTIQIYASGKQWMWTFAYPNGGGSNGVLYIPANRPVTLVLSARDVIHSFFVPEFRVKKDVIPGYVTTLWFEAKNPGVFRVFCTEYCGEGHSTMRARVVALPEPEYLEAIDQLPRLSIETAEYTEPAVVGRLPGESVTLAKMGERVAVTHGCMRCHTADGAPHIGPTWAGVFDAPIPLESGGTVRADPSYLTESMMDPLAKIRAGFEPLMPSYQGLLSAAETGALIEYIRSLSKGGQDVRSSPLARPNTPPVQLPSQSERSLAPDFVPAPFGPAPPRPDSPPYAPPGTEDTGRDSVEVEKQ